MIEGNVFCIQPTWHVGGTHLVEGLGSMGVKGDDRICNEVGKGTVQSTELGRLSGSKTRLFDVTRALV